MFNILVLFHITAKIFMNMNTITYTTGIYYDLDEITGGNDSELGDRASCACL